MMKIRFCSGLKKKINNIALLAIDVDGVLSPPHLIYNTCLDKIGDIYESRYFHVHDGSACLVAKEAGLLLSIISGRESETVRFRANKLKIKDVYLGNLNKLGAIEDLKHKYQLNDSQIAFITDDFLDLPLLKKIGLPIAVNDAVPEVKNAAAIITKKKGGHGAVREAIKLILSIQGKWEKNQKNLLRKIESM